MNLNIPPQVREAMRLMKAGDLGAATAVLRNGISSGGEVRQSGPAPGAAHVPGTFTAHTYAGPEGSRGYKLFVPERDGVEPRPLVLMLHGCTQDPDDFARGTRMNTLAAEHGCFVAYPAQPQGSNASRCWNWFRAEDQQRGRGEAGLLAGLVNALTAAHEIDLRRIYVAGMSAGGAMAAVLGATHPELFAAIGVHSGLPHGAARDLPSALAAMKGLAPASAGAVAEIPPTIVFHGDADDTVHPCNGERVASSVRHEATATAALDGAAQGRRYTRTEFRNAQGAVAAELWLVHGGRHQWSGGDAAGSHTDASGPDASHEMLRFFLERQKP
jgi:poly(hydroxyalkanoate) depolymerase family esterase